MNLQHVNLRIPVAGELTDDLEQFIGIFHRWIRETVLDELLIDVADYRHVPHGPGVMLIGHEADYSMDNAGGIPALLYNRKAQIDAGSNEDRLRDALRCAANACRLLESEDIEGGPLKFSRTTFEIIINDRALAPNTAATFAACRPIFESFLNSALGHEDFELVHNIADSRRRFSVTVKTATPIDFAKIIAGG